MVQTIQKLERSIKIRREQDISLINWWLYVFLLMPLTLTLFNIYIYFKRVGRVNNFIVRKKEYYANLLEFTEKYAADHGQSDLVHNELADLRNEINNVFSQVIKPIPAGLFLFLIIITIGIWYLVALYKMNRVWCDLQVLEQTFDDKLSVMWNKMGIIKHPLSFRIDPSKNRSFWLYLLLTFVTCGIWFVIWDYKIHNDPNNLYPEFHTVEDTILQTVRQL